MEEQLAATVPEPRALADTSGGALEIGRVLALEAPQTVLEVPAVA